MRLKPEGHQIDGIHQYEPPHPAKWCKLRYLWIVLRTGNYTGPYGEAWRCDGHVWTCYIRFRKHMIGKAPWYQLWEHMHRDFRDIMAMGSIVHGADDPFIEAKYEVSIRTVEGNVVPWPNDSHTYHSI